MYTVYKITCLIDGNFFIGKTVASLNNVMKRHISTSNHGGSSYDYPLYKAIRTHGEDSFSITEMSTYDNAYDAGVETRNLIDELKPAYNQIRGGSGVRYIDRNLVNELYNKSHSVSEVALKLDIPEITVRNHLLLDYDTEANNPSHHKRSVWRCDMDGNKIQLYNSVTDASVDMCGKGGARSVISRCCKGLTDQYKGYKWSYT